jgi:uncharacterized protein
MSDAMQFEWDERKRLSSLRKHGIDFADAILIFGDDPYIARSKFEGEIRWIALGRLHRTSIAVVFTIRGVVFRIITARRARKDEEGLIDSHHAGRGTTAEG